MKSVPAYVRIAAQIQAEWLTGSSAEVGTKLPTQEQLAIRYSVNRSTIIRALSKLISEGYLDSQQGSGIYIAEPQTRESSQRRISMIVPNLHAPVVVAACRGAERRARQLGYQVLLASSEFGLTHEKELVAEHIAAGSSGIVLYPVTRRRDDIASDYLTHWSRPAPIVTIDIGCEEWACSRVQFDNYRAGYDMTQQILQHGRRHIAFLHIDGEYLHSAIKDREQGWRAAMNNAGLKISAGYSAWPIKANEFNHPMPEHIRPSEHYDILATSLMSLHPRPDAVITWTDNMAAALIQALNNCGVRVPEDIVVAGFDSEATVSRLFTPLFPTSKPDFVRLGEIAVDTLTGMVDKPRQERRVYFYSVPILWREPEMGTANEPATSEAEPGDLPV